MKKRDYETSLNVAVLAAKQAGKLLLQDLRLPSGPRGSGAKAPADEEAETIIRDILEESFPQDGIVGEELGHRDRVSNNGFTWWIDPNDGTSAYIKGFRGSTVSIGLTHAGEPVLGVVFAFAAPDDGGDLITWAQGQALMRNGREVRRSPWPAELASDVVVAVSQHADRASNANAALCAPGRFLALPSVAYRLALVAVGEADVGVSLASPGRWDCAAGHALLRAHGGELYNFRGEALRYDEAWSEDVIGGAPALCETLRVRAWRRQIFQAPRAPIDAIPTLDLQCPWPGGHFSDERILSRAQGCLLGQLAGDALGQLVEFQPAHRIARSHPAGVRTLYDGGTYGTLAGQPTDDSEMALILARTLVRDGAYVPDAVAEGYARWLSSGPYDFGNTTRIALDPATLALRNETSPAEAAQQAANPQSQANGALMRISPLGIWGQNLAPKTLADLAKQDAELTHPHPVCQDASALFTSAIAFAVRTGAEAPEVYEFALQQAQALNVHPDVLHSLEAASAGPPEEFQHQMGWVRIAFQNAFAQLLAAPNLCEGVVDTVNRGGDTDTNAAIAGALLGAVYGRASVPMGWRRRLSSCRAIQGLSGVRHPRPRTFWPIDSDLLAEHLLLASTSRT